MENVNLPEASSPPLCERARLQAEREGEQAKLAALDAQSHRLSTEHGRLERELHELEQRLNTDDPATLAGDTVQQITALKSQLANVAEHSRLIFHTQERTRAHMLAITDRAINECEVRASLARSAIVRSARACRRWRSVYRN